MRRFEAATASEWRAVPTQLFDEVSGTVTAGSSGTPAAEPGLMCPAVCGGYDGTVTRSTNIEAFAIVPAMRERGAQRRRG